MPTESAQFTKFCVISILAINLISISFAQIEKSDLAINFQNATIFNDHIEFGLSIDPNTSTLAGRKNPQIRGVTDKIKLDLRGGLPINDRFGIEIGSDFQIENYFGENVKISDFNGLTDRFFTTLNFSLSDRFPILSVEHQIQRVDRKDNAFDSVDRQIAFRIGKLFEYNFRINHFDDDLTKREDFLLIGSSSHTAIGQFRIAIRKKFFAKIRFQFERENYKKNLNFLLRGIAKIAEDKSRIDFRNFTSVKLIEIPTDRIVLQEEINFFRSDSNLDFFDFSSLEFAIVGFGKINDRSWAKFRLSSLRVNFDGRQIRSSSANRKDDQITLNFQINWNLFSDLDLIADYSFTRNRTNEISGLFSFLNYTNNVITFRITHETQKF